MSTKAVEAKTDPALLAHLYRRAGFGINRDEIDQLATEDYSDTVEFLLNPTAETGIPEDELKRYLGGEAPHAYLAIWLYRMLNSRNQLQEKMALFWHGLFATGLVKNEHILSSSNQIEMFRENGMGEMREILMDLAKDPAMIFWLDNNENHLGEPNENWGRELLELFSLGVGNYSEIDIKHASRAFTGWTFAQSPPLYPHGYYPADFLFREDDHDNGDKEFLGHTGNLDGGDIIDIIVKQPSCAAFISRHLYNFFVADEPQVPTWNDLPPLDPELIDAMCKAFMDSDGEIKSVLRVMFNSDSFKNARFKKVKSPIEMVAGILKLAGEHTDFRHDLAKYPQSSTFTMGQILLDPPTVEGWHTGREWIDGGNLTERINFAVDQVGDGLSPGIKRIIDRLVESGSLSTPESFVDTTLDAMGPISVEDSTREALVDYARKTEVDDDRSRAVRMIRLMVSTPDFQYA
ncbi:MAG TPA: DUF1800 domain-containing protein [Dehalococcoidia bacterium]|jgi:uncharacterized protein (DUF1800 family)|nr:DUF1800 domain-containing protein [Dehalococcoidia bacterium]HIK88494.1 DUF1800 domain-containing protein [Dehalococcoidia bacterium]